MLHKLLFRFIIFIYGIRFYKTTLSLKSKEIRKASFLSLNQHVVEFLFYREECQDIIFQFDKIKKKNFVGYVVCAKFDVSLPDSLHQYNNMHFFFNSKYLKIIDEDRVCKELANIYMDFIKHQLLQKS